MKLEISEVMTISLWYHFSRYKTFKDYYTRHAQNYLKGDFTGLVSYTRFIELKKMIMGPYLEFLTSKKLGVCENNIAYIDSFKLDSCHVKRKSSHKTMKKLAKKGKTSVGWFYGMKVHLIINHRGEVISFYIFLQVMFLVTIRRFCLI